VAGDLFDLLGFRRVTALHFTMGRPGNYGGTFESGSETCEPVTADTVEKIHKGDDLTAR
jgi:hypothetical protein